MGDSNDNDLELPVLRVKFSTTARNAHLVPHNIEERVSQILVAAFADLIDEGAIDIIVTREE